jgi:hypothetical protein
MAKLKSNELKSNELKSVSNPSFEAFVEGLNQERRPTVIKNPTSYVRKKKVAIVGSASRTVNQAPYKDPDWEIWQLAWRTDEECKYASRLFDMHPINEQRLKVPKDYISVLNRRSKTMPIIGPVEDSRIPDLTVYPLAEVTAFLGGVSEYHNGDYFMSSIAYMFALAMYEGYEEIGIFGVDLLDNDEYCVAPETKVLRASLIWDEIKNIEVGDDLLAFDENPGHKTGADHYYRKWRVSTVDSVQNIIRPCYEILLENGEKLISSAEHKWLTWNNAGNFKWQRTDFLHNHQTCRASKFVKAINVWEEDKSWEAGYLAAAFDGEGWLCQATKKDPCDTYSFDLGFSQKDNPMSVEVSRIMSEKGFAFRKRQKTVSDDCYQYRLEGLLATRLECLGKIRPRRLLGKLDMEKLGVFRKKEVVPIKQITFLGNQEVIAIKTTTGTFLAEGYASHNCHQKPNQEYLIGLARGMGIKVFIPHASALVRGTHRYGYMNPPGDGAITLEALEKKLIDYRDKHQQAYTAVCTLDGAIQELTEQVNFLKRKRNGINVGGYHG